jgi:hypothetical protein
MPDTNSAMIAIPSERAPAGTPAAPIVAILLPDAERASAWILVLAAALRDKLGVATSLVTAGGKNQPRTMPAPERLERRFVRAPGDLGRLVDVAAVPLASLSHRPRIIIDVTGQPDPAADDLPVLSPVLNGQPIEPAIVAECGTGSSRNWACDWRRDAIGRCCMVPSSAYRIGNW